MKTLITGAAGFIGSNLTQALLARGHAVVGLDNLSQGAMDNLAGCIDHTRFAFCRADVREAEAVAEAAKGCAVIVHLAAYKIPRYSDAYDTLLINAMGAKHVVQAAAAEGAKVVAASTSDVYGKNPALPFSETDNLVVGPPSVRRWAYAISKMFDEQLFFAAQQRFGIDITLLRFFGGYGPNQNLSWWGGPQSVFINCALDDEPIPVHGDGQQTRTFTYISDHIDGILRAIEAPTANGQVFNLGWTEEVTIEDLARLVWRLVRGGDAWPKIEFIPYETFGKYEDVRRRVPDIALARRLLGFDPQIDLETGLRKTIRWQVQRRRALGIETRPPKMD